MNIANTGIGASVRRKEDDRFITGRGRYTDDINRPHQTYAWFLRSPYAHARIQAMDSSEARKHKGVRAVLSGKDMADDGIGGLPCGWMVKGVDGEDMRQPPRPPLAVERVAFVGEPYAIVVADSRQAARDAAELVRTEFVELPAVADPARADSAAEIHPGIPNNTCYEWEIGDGEAVAQAFAGAAHVTSLEFRNNRLIPNALEPRAAIGEFDPASGDHSLYVTSQNPHLARLIIAAFVGVAPEHKLRVVAPDVGGGFGSKIFVYPEEVSCLWAARRVGRPVKWTAERTESFLSDAHGRDHVTKAELALDKDGSFLGLRVKTIANLGAYLSTFASAVPTYLYGTLMAGQYRTPAIHVAVKSVFTNTAPVDAYRGAGRPEATYVVERLVETAARELGLDPAEIRRRNFIGADQFPYETPVALVYDSGNYEQCLARALEIADYANFPARRAQSKANGKLRGVGLSCYIEACGLAPSQMAISLGAGVGLYESGEVRVNPTGSVTVMTGTHSHGQGHETTFAQVVSSQLGIPIDQVEVVHGDTSKVEFGLGTYGSRSAAVGGSALVRAGEKIIAKGRIIAAHMLQAEPDEVEFADGDFRVRASNASVSFAEVAFRAYVPSDYPEGLEPGLSEKAFYDPANFTYPAGAYVCEVEVDAETGEAAVASFVAVDDFGKLINPLIVAGQVQGGIVQGIGQALLEGCHYDDSGQLVTGSLMDYCLPRADDAPNVQIDVVETPCPHNPLGVKGCGEAGAIGSPPAVINALTDALGVRDIAMPATSEKIWRAIRKSGE